MKACDCAVRMLMDLSSDVFIRGFHGCWDWGGWRLHQFSNVSIQMEYSVPVRFSISHTLHIFPMFPQSTWMFLRKMCLQKKVNMNCTGIDFSQYKIKWLIEELISRSAGWKRKWFEVWLWCTDLFLDLFLGPHIRLFYLLIPLIGPNAFFCSCWHVGIEMFKQAKTQDMQKKTQKLEAPIEVSIQGQDQRRPPSHVWRSGGGWSFSFILKQQSQVSLYVASSLYLCFLKTAHVILLKYYINFYLF